MKVSIVIPVYNQARYIGHAITSALAQSYLVHQVIVVDDGSTDDTAAVCHQYLDQIKYVRQANAGPSSARNTALRHSTGDAVVFLDSDDLLEHGWVERAVSAYEESLSAAQRVGIVYGNYVLFDDDGAYEKTIRIKRVSLRSLLRDSLLLPSGLFATRDCLDTVGSFNSALDTCEDWDYWLRAALQGYRFLHVDALAFRHREHSRSASKRQESALQVRVRFLQHWLAADQLSADQREVVKRELARTFLRQGRAAYYSGRLAADYVQRALVTNPRLVMDPWLFVFGAVYAAPFFRSRRDARSVQHVVGDLYRDLIDLLGGPQAIDIRLLRRLRASRHIAMAADAVLAHQYLKGGVAMWRALVSDPRLVRDAAPRILSHAAEIARVRGGL